MVIKIVWYWQRARYIDKWNRIESPKVNPSHLQLIFNKVAEIILCEKNSLFNKWCWENWTPICKKMKLDPYLTLLSKIDLKWIIDLNIRAKTIKLLEENLEGIIVTLD